MTNKLDSTSHAIITLVDKVSHALDTGTFVVNVGQFGQWTFWPRTIWPMMFWPGPFGHFF